MTIPYLYENYQKLKEIIETNGYKSGKLFLEAEVKNYYKLWELINSNEEYHNGRLWDSYEDSIHHNDAPIHKLSDASVAWKNYVLARDTLLGLIKYNFV